MPWLVLFFGVIEQGAHLRVFGDHLYYPGGEAGLYIVSLEDLDHPSLVNLYDTDGIAIDAVELGGPGFRNITYVADRFSALILDCFSPTGVREQGVVQPPSTFRLSAASPNPFNPTTRVRVTLPEAAHLEVSLFDLLGRRVALLAEGHFSRGFHSFTFNGSSFASGAYFVRAKRSGQITATRKIVLMK